MYFTIIYRTDLARKGIDFLKNPKFFSVKNIFDKKMLVGTVQNQSDVNNFVKSYQELNPKFPLVNAYFSDINGNKQNANPVISKPTTAIQTSPKPTNVNTVQSIKDSIIDTDYTLVYLGIAGIIAFIFFNKQGKRK